MSKNVYTYHIIFSTFLFICVIVSAILTSQAYGTKAMEEALAINGIDANQSWDNLNNDQKISLFAASSLLVIPPGSEIQILIQAIIGIAIGIILLYVILRYCGSLITRLFFTLSLTMLISMFFVSIGYLLFGAQIFTVSHVLIIFGISLALVLIWLVYPEWWMVTTMAVIIASAGAAFFGASFEPLSIAILLIVLAIYDYIAVIRTKVMVNFAKKVMSVQLPAAITLPYDSRSSLITNGVNFNDVESRSDRGFMILGTGDLLFPTMLAVSISIYYNSIWYGFVVGGFIIAAYMSMMYLMYYKENSKIQALPGLPFLCTGAFIGYVIIYLIALV